MVTTYVFSFEYAGSKDFLVLNPEASKRYFHHQSIATTGNHEIFKRKRMKIQPGSLYWGNRQHWAILTFTMAPSTDGCNTA